MTRLVLNPHTAYSDVGGTDSAVILLLYRKFVVTYFPIFSFLVGSANRPIF